MCNLYSHTSAREAMRRLFNADDAESNQPPLPAIFPDVEAPIIIERHGQRLVKRAR